jgi:hypothetical protein
MRKLSIMQASGRRRWTRGANSPHERTGVLLMAGLGGRTGGRAGRLAHQLFNQPPKRAAATTPLRTILLLFLSEVRHLICLGCALKRASHIACTPKGARPFRRRRRRHKLRVRVADTAAHTQKHRLGSRHGNQLADSCACSAAVGERASSSSSSSAGSPFHATPIHKGLAPRQ